jgi:type VII secretion protein EccB
LADANHQQSPNRMNVGATIVGVLVTVLVLVGFGILGFLKPGNSQTWKDGNSIIVEKETTTRFVYVQAQSGGGKELREIANFSSGLLFLNKANTGVVSVSRGSLAGIPRGPKIGIAGAPDSLPPLDKIYNLNDRWSFCNKTQTEGEPHPKVVLIIGDSTKVAEGDSSGILVRTQNGSNSLGARYLIYQGRRYLIGSPDHPDSADRIMQALSLPASQTLVVGQSWLNPIPAGPALNYLKVPDWGTNYPGTNLRIGEIFQADRYDVLLTAQGLDYIYPTQSALMFASPNRPAGLPRTYSQFVNLQTAQANVGIPKVNTDPDSHKFPAAIAKIASVSGASGGNVVICGQYLGKVDGEGLPAMAFALRTDAPNGVKTNNAGGAPLDPDRAADEVYLAPQHGVLAVTQVSATSNTNAAYLITNSGQKYPVPSSAVFETLGFGKTAPVPIPTGLLAMIGDGPTLDPKNAGQPISS